MASNISNVKANIPFSKTSYKKFVSLGEKATGDAFKMVVEGYPDLEFLVSATQLPPLAREQVESYGPGGVKFVQQGRFKNAVDVTITFLETLQGHAYKAIRDWVANKKYLTVNLSLASEGGEAVAGTAFTLEDTWIELDGVDLSTEDNTVLKASGTLHANWFDPAAISSS
jgi:hypothetical protein